MSFIDLHVHSTASDGTLTPAEIVTSAISADLSAIALTDHDTVDGVPSAKKAARATSLEVISGIELSCLYTTKGTQEKELHILGFFIDETSEELLDSLTHMREVREQRNQKMISRFSEDGIFLTESDLKEGNPNTVVTRAHFARALFKLGVVSSMDQAFQKYLVYDSPYCPVRKQPTPAAAIELIKKAGGFPALAHPLQYKLGWHETEQLIAQLKEDGLMGVEVWHSSHNQGSSSRLQEITSTIKLLPTGGSDFHGANKADILLGRGHGGLRVSHFILEDIKKCLHRG